jgi:hypothetical protein
MSRSDRETRGGWFFCTGVDLVGVIAERDSKIKRHADISSRVFELCCEMSIPISCITWIARMLTMDRRVPVMNTSTRSPYFARKSPSAIRERAAFAVQTKKTHVFCRYLSSQEEDFSP